MPTPTYDLIASNVLGTTTTTITFSSIPASYRDLVLVANCLGSSATNALSTFRFNSDTGSNYSMVTAKGDGTNTASQTITDTSLYAEPFTNSLGSGGRLLWIANIMDYSATNKHKSVLVRTNRADLLTVMAAGRWANTSAINTITISKQGTSDYAAGSSFYLYGIVS